MNTRAEIVQAIEDYNAGRRGTIPADQLGPRNFVGPKPALTGTVRVQVPYRCRIGAHRTTPPRGSPGVPNRQRDMGGEPVPTRTREVGDRLLAERIDPMSQNARPPEGCETSPTAGSMTLG